MNTLVSKSSLTFKFTNQTTLNLVGYGREFKKRKRSSTSLVHLTVNFNYLTFYQENEITNSKISFNELNIEHVKSFYQK